MPYNIEHARAGELDRISQMLEYIPIITDPVSQDITQGVESYSGTEGMSVEQVLGAAIVKQTKGFSYEELAFHRPFFQHLIDSRA